MLTTVAACKTFRGIPVEDTQHDEELERLILVVQAFLENQCGRKFDDSGTTDLVEYFSGCDFSRQLIVARPPIISITDIQIDNLRAWTNPVLDQQYYGIYDAEAGIIKMLHGFKLPDGILNVRLRYRGGYSAATMPRDLEQAAIEMVWANRAKGEHNLIGVRSRGSADGSVQYVNLDWPMNLSPIIDKYSIRTRFQ